MPSPQETAGRKATATATAPAATSTAATTTATAAPQKGDAASAAAVTSPASTAASTPVGAPNAPKQRRMPRNFYGSMLDLRIPTGAGAGANGTGSGVLNVSPSAGAFATGTEDDLSPRLPQSRGSSLTLLLGALRPSKGTSSSTTTTTTTTPAAPGTPSPNTRDPTSSVRKSWLGRTLGNVVGVGAGKSSSSSHHRSRSRNSSEDGPTVTAPGNYGNGNRGSTLTAGSIRSPTPTFDEGEYVTGYEPLSRAASAPPSAAVSAASSVANSPTFPPTSGVMVGLPAPPPSGVGVASINANAHQNTSIPYVAVAGAGAGAGAPPPTTKTVAFATGPAASTVTTARSATSTATTTAQTPTIVRPTTAPPAPIITTKEKDKEDVASAPSAAGASATAAAATSTSTTTPTTDAVALLESRMGDRTSAEYVVSLAKLTGEVITGARPFFVEGVEHRNTEDFDTVGGGGGGAGGVDMSLPPQDSTSSSVSRSSEWASSSLPDTNTIKEGSGGGGGDAATKSFYGTKMPKIRLDKYLARLARYIDSFNDEAPCGTSTGMCCLAWSMVLMDRLARRRGLHVDPMNVHRLFMTASLLAFKTIDDEPCNNAYFANVGGVDLDELNRLEARMLVLLDFRTNVSAEDLREAMEVLRVASAGALAASPVPAAAVASATASASSPAKHMMMRSDDRVEVGGVASAA